MIFETKWSAYWFCFSCAFAIASRTLRVMANRSSTNRLASLILYPSSSAMTPPRGRSWVVAANGDLSSLLWSTDNVCRYSDLTLSCVVTTASLKQVSAIILAKPLRSSAFDPGVVRGPRPLRPGLRTNETGVRGWRSPLT